MSFKHSGFATLKLPNGGIWKVFPDAVDFEAVGGSERGMGEEALYSATYQIKDSSNAPGGEWTVSIYPVNVLNHVSFSPLNGAELVSDFDYEIEHEQEI